MASVAEWAAPPASLAVYRGTLTRAGIGSTTGRDGSRPPGPLHNCTTTGGLNIRSVVNFFGFGNVRAHKMDNLCRVP